MRMPCMRAFLIPSFLASSRRSSYLSNARPTSILTISGIFSDLKKDQHLPLVILGRPIESKNCSNGRQHFFGNGAGLGVRLQLVFGHFLRNLNRTKRSSLWKMAENAQDLLTLVKANERTNKTGERERMTRVNFQPRTKPVLISCSK